MPEPQIYQNAPRNKARRSNLQLARRVNRTTVFTSVTRSGQPDGRPYRYLSMGRRRRPKDQPCNVRGGERERVLQNRSVERAFSPCRHARQASTCPASAGGAGQQSPGWKSPRSGLWNPGIGIGLIWSPEGARQVLYRPFRAPSSLFPNPGLRLAALRLRPGLCCAALSALRMVSLSLTRMPCRALCAIPGASPKTGMKSRLRRSTYNNHKAVCDLSANGALHFSLGQRPRS